MAKKGDLVCCNMCGRDTKAADGICARCRNSNFDHTEEIGRKARSFRTDADSPFEDVYDDNEYHPNSYENYHGESIRDDL